MVASSQALPGEILYPVKTSIREGIQERLALSPEGQGRAEADLAEERLKEAEALALSGSLNSYARVVIMDNFEQHSDEVIAIIQGLLDDGDFEGARRVSIYFGSILTTHLKVIEKLQDTESFEEDLDLILTKADFQNTKTAQTYLGTE